jgi:hypothetical protein
MRILVYLSLVVALLALGVLPLCPAQEKPGRDPKAENQEFYKVRSALAGRRAGAMLQATVAIADGPDRAEEIQLNWTLDYTGPRPPLIILRPSLEDGTAGQTRVILYAEGKDGRVYEGQLESPTPPLVQGTPKEWFLTIPPGKTATGELKISARRVADCFQQPWPKQFDDTPPILHVQLIHKPHHRGGDLDAWTGELYTPVLKVPLKKW